MVCCDPGLGMTSAEKFDTNIYGFAWFEATWSTASLAGKLVGMQQQSSSLPEATPGTYDSGTTSAVTRLACWKF